MKGNGGTALAAAVRLRVAAHPGQSGLSHPNIEVRMFNPVAMRSLRVLGMVADFGRINKRMHNKSFIADGEVAIVGGRNIGDEYFGAHEKANYADLDVAVIGGLRRCPTNSTFTGIIRLRFELRLFRDKTRRPRSSPRSGLPSPRSTRPRSILPFSMRCVQGQTAPRSSYRGAGQHHLLRYSL